MPVRSFLITLALVILSAPALADGKVFTVHRSVPSIPDQEAIIHWADGLQTLIIETRFQSTEPATDSSAPAAPASPQYAWIVPVPAHHGPPQLLEATRGCLPTVRAIFAPRIILRGPEATNGTLAVLLGLGIMSLLSRQAWVRRTLPWASVILVLLSVMILLPSLGAARSALRGDSSIQVHERRVLGALDVAVIGIATPGEDAGTALTSWLNDHGFVVPPQAQPVLADYAARGWCFIAAKLDAGVSSAERLAPHPLAVRFLTPEPIYPLALTGVDAGPLTVDLYVFGSKMARASGFQVRRCSRIVERRPGRDSPDIVIAHPGLASLVPSAKVATHLAATLAPDQMQQDLTLSWASPRFHGGVLHAPAVRRIMAWNAAAAAFPVAMLLLVIAALARDWPQRWRWWGSGAVAMLSAIFGLVVLLKTESVPPHMKSVDQRLVWREAEALGDAVAEAIGQLPEQPDTVDEVRALVDSILADTGWSGGRFAAAELREEDSPFNYTLHADAEGRIHFTWFDEYGKSQSRRLTR